MLMNEFNVMSKGNTLNDMKDRIMEIERLSSLWTSIADQTFDEELKLSKLRTVIPTTVYNYIAVEARKCKRYDELVQLVEAQVMDPITGLMRGEKTPGLSSMSTGQQPGRKAEASEGAWSTEAVQEYLQTAGVNCQSPEGEWILNAVGKGKGK